MRTLPGEALLEHLDPPRAPAETEAEHGSGLGPPSREHDRRLRFVERGIDIAVVAAATLFVFAQLGPHDILTNSTPAGGDMGAHVWAPLYLRDHLLPSLRLTGWTPDWYAGFPVFRFYMVVPAIAIVLLNAGAHGWAGLLPTAAAVALGVGAWRAPRHSARRRLLTTAAVLVALLGIGLPYGVAFKLVAVSGLVAMPVAAYAFGRLCGLPFPSPALLSAASLLFMFNREPTNNGTGNIIGGNVTSTLAGEYSFSIALSLGLVFLGLVVHGMRTGRRRPIAAVLLALTFTCHLIVGFFVAIAALIALVVWPGLSRLRWTVPVAFVGLLLGSFWLVPFALGHAYVNDMGWEKSPPGIVGKGSTAMLTDSKIRDAVIHDYLLPSGLYLVIALAAVGIAVSVLLQIRVGWWLGITALVMAIGFVFVPEDRLWNARVLPFYYLCLCLLAAIGVAEVARALALLVAGDPTRPSFATTAAAPLLGGLLAIVVVGFPMQSLPSETATGASNGKTAFSWGPINLTLESNPARSWARWNFTGYEGKATYPEYRALVETMRGLGQSRGCGRAMWEYEADRLNGYGTPMAPMLLPMWTDGCIGSMEGLYFESSMTTPFHFLDQAELSTACSCAQRNLPYGGFNMSLGVEHLQLLGVRYYMASTTGAVQAAQRHPALTEIAVSGPWHVFEIADSALVTPLTNEPAVATWDTVGLKWVYGDGSPHTSKVKANGPALSWYLDPSRWDVMVAADGPSSWARVSKNAALPKNPLPPVHVSGATQGDDSISFEVDRTGVPVLVKASYFPNWQADGAKGPYRVAPNLMVVIPTKNHVSMHFGRSSVDLGAYALTAIGIGFLVLLARRRDVTVPSPEDTSDYGFERLREQGRAGRDLDAPPPSPDESRPVPDFPAPDI